MDYILKNKDQPLIEFVLDINILGEYFVEITKVYSEGVFPLGLEINNESLLKWLENRNIPKNREFVNEILASIGVARNDLLGLLNIGKSLSLNDAYWVVGKNFDGRFEDYNLYENDFNKAVALVAYTGHGFSKSVGTLPELTTGGSLRKAWRNVHDGIYLYKGGRKGFSNAGVEPYSEFYAAQIARAMGLDYVDYELEVWSGELASYCKLFTDIDTEYTPVYSLINKYSSIKQIIDLYQDLGEDYYQSFCSMMVFDALIFNVDRHLNNFGFLRDANNGKIIKTAPLFDHGISLFSEAADSSFNSFEELMVYSEVLTPAIGTSFSSNVALFKGELQQKQLYKLLDFKFTRHSKYNLSDERLDLIEMMIHYRVSELLKVKKIDLDLLFRENNLSNKTKEQKFVELNQTQKEEALKEIRFSLDNESLNWVDSESVVDNYVYICSDTDNSVSLIELEPLDNYLKKFKNVDLKRGVHNLVNQSEMFQETIKFLYQSNEKELDLTMDEIHSLVKVGIYNSNPNYMKDFIDECDQFGIKKDWDDENEQYVFHLNKDLLNQFDLSELEQQKDEVELEDNSISNDKGMSL